MGKRPTLACLRLWQGRRIKGFVLSKVYQMTMRFMLAVFNPVENFLNLMLSRRLTSSSAAF
jgi:hypothetical protein